MNTQTQDPTVKKSEDDERQSLEDSEKKASRTHPENYRDEAQDDKIVEIPPIDDDKPPIRGLDPKP